MMIIMIITINTDVTKHIDLTVFITREMPFSLFKFIRNSFVLRRMTRWKIIHPHAFKYYFRMHYTDKRNIYMRQSTRRNGWEPDRQIDRQTDGFPGCIVNGVDELESSDKCGRVGKKKKLACCHHCHVLLNQYIILILQQERDFFQLTLCFLFLTNTILEGK